jgi:hypothetical protein
MTDIMHDALSWGMSLALQQAMRSAHEVPVPVDPPVAAPVAPPVALPVEPPVPAPDE